MKSATLLLCSCLAACWYPLSDHNWHVQSWDGDVFTIAHDGQTYRAICESVAASSDGRVTLPDAMDQRTLNPRCEATIGLVGHEVRPFDATQLPAAGKQKDADGFVVTMAHVGSSLMLRRWLNEHTTTEELLKITSVTTTAQ